MIDHVSLRVSDFDKALALYRAALAPLGYEVLMQFPDMAGLGAGGKPDLWITHSEQPINPAHIAISGERAQIDAFHAAALAAGGQDNGAPGLRPDYHPNYYAAFILDADGNNLEVVCHDAPGAAKARKPVARAKKPAAKKPAAKKPAAKKPAKAAAKKPAKAAAKKPAAKKPAAKKPAKAAAKKPTKKARGRK